ncbi:hypothetical protein AK812_SmicGene41215 [Symbiodinium microadriaticum]|uniref:Uncharacterized protein n=1 Tax=Symbiodinium microadriaticum TaxID=2951 RepID=A0A1Q9C6P1_SYMMI|nr:hypothetical protein AK812_SmicGene41215 [Symbiodinium microadriaticum]
MDQRKRLRRYYFLSGKVGGVKWEQRILKPWQTSNRLTSTAAASALPEGYQNAKYEVQVLSESFKDLPLLSAAMHQHDSDG